MPASGFTVGERRRHVLLGSEAIYRVCDWDEELVELEVVSAPGLKPGQRLHCTVEAARRMTVVAGNGSQGHEAP